MADTELPIWRRESEGRSLEELHATCPRRGEVTVDVCARCARADSVTVGGPAPVVRCDPAREISPAPAGATEAPPRTVEALMERTVLAASPDLTVGALRWLIESRQLGAIPIVDGGEVVGLVSAADISGVRASLPASEVMRELLCTLSHDAPVELAAAVLAHERLCMLPIVGGEDRRLRGVLRCHDVLRWVARAHGYVVVEADPVEPGPEG